MQLTQDLIRFVHPKRVFVEGEHFPCMFVSFHLHCNVCEYVHVEWFYLLCTIHRSTVEYGVVRN